MARPGCWVVVVVGSGLIPVGPHHGTSSFHIPTLYCKLQPLYLSELIGPLQLECFTMISHCIL